MIPSTDVSGATRWTVGSVGGNISALTGTLVPREPRVNMRWEKAAYRFDGFELLPGVRSLRHDGKEVAITPRAFDLLVALVERAGVLVSKGDLLEQVWPRAFVEENNLQAQISVLRKILGAHAIATVPGRGYAFKLTCDASVPAPPRGNGRDEPGSAAVGNLPARLARLYGRTADLTALAGLLESQRAVTIVGSAGIGKTTLARAIAHDLGAGFGGAWLIELAPIADPRLVPQVIAGALGIAAGSNDEAGATLVEGLRSRSMLLVLDNCEHLLVAVARLAGAILAGAPQVRLLVTSQEPLHIAEESVYRLNTLAVPAAVVIDTALDYGAVEMFAARAQAADPRFALTADNTEVVVEICRRLDGMALAIELAAARVPLLGVRGVCERLDDRFRLLAGGLRNALPRHRTLHAALEWSYALLSDDEQRVFDRLGVFVGSFSLHAAQQLVADDTIDAWAALDHLASLVDKSLVLVEAGDAPRYRLLETTRAFALQRLAADGALDALRRRHAHVIAETLAGDDPLEGPSARIRRQAPDLDNLRAAAAWATGPGGDRTLAISLAGGWIWDALGCQDEGERLYATVEPWVDATTPPVLVARFWLAVSDQRRFVGLKRQARVAVEAARLFLESGDRTRLFRALHNAAWTFSLLRDVRAARRALDDMREMIDPSSPLWFEAALDHVVGFHLAFAERRLPQARLQLEKAVASGRRCGSDAYFAEACEGLLCWVDYAVGDFEAVTQRARALVQRVPKGFVVKLRARLVEGLALVALGRLEEAQEVLRATLPLLWRTSGASPTALGSAAILLTLQGRFEDAALVLGYVESLDTSDIAFPPGYERMMAHLRAVIADATGLQALERLQAQGRRLGDQGALALAASHR